MTERKTWVIPADKWHARIYRAWRKVGTIKANSNYSENLCHYWRVVIFWAPVTIFCKWFFFNKTPKRPYNYNDDVPPAMWVALIGVFGGFAGALYTSMTWQGATAVLFGIPALFMGVILVAVKWDERKQRIRREQRLGLRNTETSTKSERQPNLLFEVLRAKKHKICPLIEIENGDAR
jgi:hypothetical protein